MINAGAQDNVGEVAQAGGLPAADAVFPAGVAAVAGLEEVRLSAAGVGVG